MMTARAMILDMDGTLVDTNGAHIEAWRRAFARFGHDVPAERILPEVGKGGDLLVPAILGEAEGEREGDALRAAHGEEFLAIAASSRFAVFDGAEALLRELRRRGIRTALATSSDARYVDATLESAGFPLRELVDVATTNDDADASKPCPDIIVAALEKLGEPAGACIMLGDTRHDGTASGRAGVPFAGVLCGGAATEAILREAGAVGVWRDPAAVLAELDTVLGAGRPATR
jgi:phosphoglycolate phosphatase-like HAD superfamily hydrolase